MRLKEQKENCKVSRRLESIKGIEREYERLDKVHANLGGIINELKYRLEEAQEIGLVDQDLMSSNRNISGKIDVVEVENLFECEGEVV